MNRGSYLQLGYVTNDIEQAMALFRSTENIGSFKEMRDLTIGARGDRTVTAHFALAFKGGTQFELIQPLAGDAEFYSQVLPAEFFAIRLHHLGHYYPDASIYLEAKRRAEDRWPIEVDVPIFDGEYCYFDARHDLGHHVELYTFPVETHFDGVPNYP